MLRVPIIPENPRPRPESGWPVSHSTAPLSISARRVPCPLRGGPTVDRMSKADAARDRAARLEISHELGHGRLDVTDTYLGRRLPVAKRAA